MKGNWKWKTPHNFGENNFVPQPIEESRIKSKTVMSYSSRKKKKTFFLPFILFEGNFLKIFVLSRGIVY